MGDQVTEWITVSDAMDMVLSSAHWPHRAELSALVGFWDVPKADAAACLFALSGMTLPAGSTDAIEFLCALIEAIDAVNAAVEHGVTTWDKWFADGEHVNLASHIAISCPNRMVTTSQLGPLVEMENGKYTMGLKECGQGIIGDLVERIAPSNKFGRTND